MTLALTVSAIAIAAFTWWFATGAVLWLGRLHSEWHGVASLSLAVPAGLAFLLALAIREDATIAAAIAGFMAAIAIWAWHEAAFLFGQVLGPRREPCPSGARSRTRFGLAFAAMRDHEFALFGTLVLLAIVTWGSPNTVAVQTFATLWFCRLAAKLCIFEGVPAMAHDLMPERLAHLKSYFGEGQPGFVFALALSAMAAALVVLVHLAWTAGSGFTVIGNVLLATLVGLAILEHLFMVLPIKDERLWRWAVPHAGPKAAGECVLLRAPGSKRRLQGVALEARAVVPLRRAP